MQINVNFIFNWEIFFRVLHNFEFLDSLQSPFLLVLEERIRWLNPQWSLRLFPKTLILNIVFQGKEIFC